MLHATRQPDYDDGDADEWKLLDITEQSNATLDPVVRTGARLEGHSCDECPVGPRRLLVDRTLVEAWVATTCAVDRVHVYHR